jgi:hypothetical protein
MSSPEVPQVVKNQQASHPAIDGYPESLADVADLPDIRKKRKPKKEQKKPTLTKIFTK